MIKNLKIKKDVVWLIVTIGITLLGIILVYELWNKDFNVPIVYNGDGVGAVFTINNFLNGKEFWKFDNIAAPYGETVLSQDYFLSIFIIKVLALFSRNTGVVVNLYWLLTYILTAATMYFLLRKIEICPEIAMLGAVVYDFLPYHYFRLQHFWLMGCYLIPLAVWLIVDMMDAHLFELENGNKINILQFIKSRKFIVDLIFCILIGFGGIYYAVFTVVLLVCVGLYRAIECKKISYIFLMIIFSVIIALPVILFYLIPMIKMNYSAFSASAGTRNITQIDTFGLKLCLLLFPIPGHRLSVLSDFTTNFFNTMGGNTEAYIVQMGAVMSLGLIISVFSLFCTKIWGKGYEKIVQYGRVNIIIILISVVGGLDTFIAIFVSSTIRCYNRMVVFIAVFSMMCICVLLNQVYENGKIKMYMKYIITIFIIIFAIWDQTSSNFAKYEQYNLRSQEYDNLYVDNKIEYYNNKLFIDNIIEKLDSDQMVYLMPFKSEWSPDRLSFNKKKAVIASYDTNWSFSVENIEYQNYMRNLEDKEINVFLDTLSIMGFSGIVIDRNGYSSDKEFEEKIFELEQYISAKPLVDESGLLYFYDTKQYKKDLLSKYTESEINKIYNGLEASIYSTGGSLMNKNLEVTDEIKNDKLTKSLHLQIGQTQYGPYIELEKGYYEIAILGNNLINANVWVTAQSGEIQIPIEIIEHSDSCIRYKFRLSSPQHDVEFLMVNETQEMIINEYYYNRYESEKSFEKYKDSIKDIILFKQHIDNNNFYSKILFNKLWISDTAYVASENILFIEKGILQYGPYISLEPGEYRVIIQGEKLAGGEIKATYSAGKETIEITEIGRTNNSLVYGFNLDKKVDLVEFLLINSESDMVIDEYGYERSEIGKFPKSESVLSIE